jgi:hypothetical protein
MDDNNPKPMLNSPIESPSDSAEELQKNVIARMDGAHDAQTEVNRMFAELPAAEQERLEKFKQETFAHFEEITGLTFDRETGKCTTPGKVKFEGAFKEKWTALGEQFIGQHDHQQGEQLMREAGRLLREAAQQNEAGTIDGDDRKSE